MSNFQFYSLNIHQLTAICRDWHFIWSISLGASSMGSICCRCSRPCLCKIPLEQLTSLDNTPLLQISIIGFITIIFITSVISGINQGMRYLSIINLTIACFLLFMVIVLGPTLFIMEHFTKTLGSYISNFVTLSFFSL